MITEASDQTLTFFVGIAVGTAVGLITATLAQLRARSDRVAAETLEIEDDGLGDTEYGRTWT